MGLCLHGHDRVHVSWLAGDVRDQDGGSARGDDGFDLRGTCAHHMPPQRGLAIRGVSGERNRMGQSMAQPSAPALKVPWCAASATIGMQLCRQTGMQPPGSVIGGTTTSEPGGRQSAPSATYTAQVPEFTRSAKPPPMNAENSSQ